VDFSNGRRSVRLLESSQLLCIACRIFDPVRRAKRPKISGLQNVQNRDFLPGPPLASRMRQGQSPFFYSCCQTVSGHRSACIFTAGAQKDTRVFVSNSTRNLRSVVGARSRKSHREEVYSEKTNRPCSLDYFRYGLMSGEADCTLGLPYG